MDKRFFRAERSPFAQKGVSKAATFDPTRLKYSTRGIVRQDSPGSFNGGKSINFSPFSSLFLFIFPMDFRELF